MTSLTVDETDEATFDKTTFGVGLGKNKTYEIFGHQKYKKPDYFVQKNGKL